MSSGRDGKSKGERPRRWGQSSIGALRKTPVGILDGHGEFADASKARGLISTTFVGRNSDTCCRGCREPGFIARAAALVRSSADGPAAHACKLITLFSWQREVGMVLGGQSKGAERLTRYVGNSILNHAFITKFTWGPGSMRTAPMATDKRRRDSLSPKQ
jgi:hypothetical protein